MGGQHELAGKKKTQLRSHLTEGKKHSMKLQKRKSHKYKKL